MLFTFEDQETGELRDTLAPNKAAARLQLGGIWTDIERTAAWQPCEIAGLPEIFREAQAAEEAAHHEAMAANPMGQGRFTSPEALAKLTAAQEKHRKLQVRRQALMHLVAAAGQ
jgi:hypothetical protein